jgi:hypothetical protein
LFRKISDWDRQTEMGGLRVDCRSLHCGRDDKGRGDYFRKISDWDRQTEIVACAKTADPSTAVGMTRGEGVFRKISDRDRQTEMGGLRVDCRSLHCGRDDKGENSRSLRNLIWTSLFEAILQTDPT